MVNAVDLGLVENGLNLGAQLAGAAEVVPEGFLDDEPPPSSARGLCQPGGADLLGDGCVKAGLGGKVEKNVVAGVAVFGDFIEQVAKLPVIRGGP